MRRKRSTLYNSRFPSKEKVRELLTRITMYNNKFANHICILHKTGALVLESHRRSSVFSPRSRTQHWQRII